ncbi:hypothetical protein ACFQ64_19450 [Streptomyces sp. NPDC056460]|uniref:hypothetical protein n=1 Tax=Streptomyces sp. NPDC056460 TaxID=3345825 RepID=UPI0036892703
MTAFHGPVETQPGVLVHTRRSREAGAATWLLLAARDPGQARREWATYGVALLRCGTLFSAVRIPASVVHTAAGTSDRTEVADYLLQALEGPCFFDGTSQAFYALTPRSTAARWNVPGTEALGADFFLGVPATGICEPGPMSAAWWVVPMDGPAALCHPDAVRRLVQQGRIRRTPTAAQEAGEDA